MKSQNTPIEELIEAIGPRNMQRVLEILGDPKLFTLIELPPIRMLNAMLYRKIRNQRAMKA